MEKEEKVKKIFDPYEAGVTKQLDAKNVRNLSSRQPVGDVRHSNIFSKLGLSQEESNLAHHFTTSSDRYINEFNKTNPSHPLPSDNDDVRLHLLGRFARTLNSGPSHSTMVSLLEKLADRGLITRDTRNPGKSNQYIMKGFKLQKGPAAQEESPEETTPKSSTDVEETELASDVLSPVEEDEKENKEENEDEDDTSADDIEDSIDESQADDLETEHENISFLDEKPLTVPSFPSEAIPSFNRNFLDLYKLFGHANDEDHFDMVSGHKLFIDLIEHLKTKKGGQEHFTTEQMLQEYIKYLPELKKQLEQELQNATS